MIDAEGWAAAAAEESAGIDRRRRVSGGREVP
jgi:hypothetical protein